MSRVSKAKEQRMQWQGCKGKCWADEEEEREEREEKKVTREMDEPDV